MRERRSAHTPRGKTQVPRELAAALYQMWLGASVMAKIVRTQEPFETATQATRRLLGLPV